MWAKIAEEMAIPWRAAEAMHWQMGEVEMARRAGVTPFTLTNANANANANNNNTHNSQQTLTSARHNTRPPTSRPRGDSISRGISQQQLPSLAELTAGLPAYSHSLPGYPFSDLNRAPGTPHQHSTLPYPRQSSTPPPGNLQQSEYFLRRP